MKKIIMTTAFVLATGSLLTACGGESEDEKIERLTNSCISAFERDPMTALQNNADCKELMELGVDIERRMR